MRTWILGVALAGATGGGVAFVLAGKPDQSHCGPCVEARPAATDCTADGCPSCKVTPPSDAADVTDLSALLATQIDSNRPRVSFDEPPFAHPVKATVAELAPQPRGVAEECPMPRPVAEMEEAPMPRMTE